MQFTCLQRKIVATSFLAFFFLNGFTQLAVAGFGLGYAPRANDGDEAGEAEIICACTCCGDVCPMGRYCCCDAPKLPIQPLAGPYLAAWGCHPGEQAAGNEGLTFLGYRYLPLPRVDIVAPSATTELPAERLKRPLAMDYTPEPPPPRQGS